MRRKLPTSGDQVASMPEDARFGHVRKHLYSERERWQDIVPALPAPPCARATAAGCSHRAVGRGPFHVERESKSCIEQVHDDHDDFYEPAYRSALDTACEKRRLGPALENTKGKLRAVGDNGVFLFLRRDRRGSTWVSSAIRVRPGGTQRPSPEDFFKAAVSKLRDTTSWR